MARELTASTRIRNGYPSHLKRNSQTDAPVKKMFAQMKSNGCTDKENFLHGCSQMDTWLTKILERMQSIGQTTKKNNIINTNILEQVPLQLYKNERGRSFSNLKTN